MHIGLLLLRYGGYINMRTKADG